MSIIKEFFVIDSAENEDDLERQWNEWNQQTHANRRRSNNQCLIKYGMTNLDRYEHLKGSFNKQPIDPVTVEDPEVTGDNEDPGTNDDSVHESEAMTRQQMVAEVEKQLKTLGIKSGIEKGGEWGLDDFYSGKSDTLFVCTTAPNMQKELKKNTVIIGGKLKSDNYNTIFLKSKVDAVVENELLYPEYNPSITTEEALKQGGFYDSHGVWNSIMKIPNDPKRIYRGRVECLIIKGNEVYLCKRPTDEYRLPGGSFEIKNDNVTQCYNECKEEARILTKNIKFTGITYARTYSCPADWARDLPVQWTGQYIEVYVADYDRYYNGQIDRNDRDEDMYNNGRFYNIDDVYDILRDEHKKAIDIFVRKTVVKEEAEETLEVIGGAEKINMDQEVPNPLGSVSDEMYDAAKEWSNRSNIKMILERYVLDRLEREYSEFMLQTYYHRKISNQESIRIFGFNNLTHYEYLRNRMLERDKTEVKVDDVVNTEDDSHSHTTISEHTLPTTLQKKIDIIKEELLYDYDKVIVHNMLDDLWEENANFSNKAVVKNFISETIEFMEDDDNTPSLLPYYTPREMDELGVYNEDPSDNFYKTTSNKEAREWYDLYTRTGNPGIEWYKKVGEAYGDMIKNPTDENKQKVLEFGWNPELSLSLSVLKETSKLTKQKLDKRYNIEVIDITESLNDLDDYQEVPYITKFIIQYKLDSYMTGNIELEHTTGRIFTDYNGNYVAHISVYNRDIVGIGSWYKGPELLTELIDWAIKEKKVNRCYCRRSDITLKRVLDTKGFIPTDGDRIVIYALPETDVKSTSEYGHILTQGDLAKYKTFEIEHKASAYNAREMFSNMLNDIGYQGYSTYKNCFELRDVESDDGMYIFAKWDISSLDKSQRDRFFDTLVDMRSHVNSRIDGFLVNGANRAKTYGFLGTAPNTVVSEATKDNNKLLPVYIVTCYTASPFGMAIQKFTNTLYTHASLGFDSTLDKLYSFNVVHTEGKHGGLSLESVNQYIKDNDNADLNVSVVYLKEKDHRKLQDRLDMYLNNVEKTSYSFKNLFNIVINKVEDSSEQFSMVCSQFVDSMFKAINVDLTNKPSNLVTPGDLSRIDNPKVYKVYEGKAKNYNPKKTEIILHKLIGSVRPIKESAFIRDARIGIYRAIPIFEAKEFPIAFDDSGALLIKNYKTIDYNVEYSRSNKLLKSYKANKNWTGMEYELSKLWFMNEVLLKKIEVAKDKEEKDALIKTRAKVMNDFTIYLNELNKNVEGFNFSEYYEQTPFSDTVIKISGSTLKYSAKYLKAAIKAIV